VRRFSDEEAERGFSRNGAQALGAPHRTGRGQGGPGAQGVQQCRADGGASAVLAAKGAAPLDASANGGAESGWITQSDDPRPAGLPPTLAPDQLVDPPVSLIGEPRVTARPSLVTANSDHAVHFTVAEMEARARWQVDASRSGTGDWAVGFYQSLIPLDMHHCYERLSRPPGPGSFPTPGPHWITRRQPIRSHEFDFLHRTPLSGAGSGRPVEAVTRDLPGVRRANAFIQPSPDEPYTRIRESAYVADFSLQAVAVNTAGNSFMPLWTTRWMVATRVGHRHPGAPSSIDSFELTPYRARVVSSRAHSAHGGDRGLVSGIAPSSSRSSVGGWEPGCPAVS
jgi:hypothetical protein